MDIENSQIPNIQVRNIGTGKKPHFAIKGFVELTHWSGYFLDDHLSKSKKEKVVTNGRIDLWVDGAITPDRNFSVDQEQENAYWYLVNHQEKIKRSILEYLKKNFPRLLSEEYASWEQDHPDFPAVADFTPGYDFKNFIGPESISIGEDVKDEMAYLTWHFRCRWDVEHGIGVITHKDRVIDLSPEVDPWKIYEDNGTFEEEEQRYSKQNSKIPSRKKKWWQFW